MSGALLRKQPDRKAKKRTQESMANSKSEKFSKVPRRQSKSKMTMDLTSFDPIDELLSNYGEITGKSLAHEIFSYLDFSTLQKIRLVHKSWNFFLTNDRRLWLNILRGTKPFIEFLSNEIAGEKNSAIWKECYDEIGFSDDFSYLKVYQTMRQIQGIFMVFQRGTNFYLRHDNIFGKFKKYFVGEKLTEELQLEINMSKNPLLVLLQKKLRAVRLTVWKRQAVENYHLWTNFSANPDHPDYESLEDMNLRINRDRRVIEGLDKEYGKLSNEVILGMKENFLNT